ncbi:transcription elongation factor GreB [Wenzhouxiangella sp. EGI_FJ10409]|uniref:transcription elongation factor GreB n=1 Tax=Wenzhouxiangella sp. EGI_FJ10409 TaxID=3243767 RepID=UPI0035D57B2A
MTPDGHRQLQDELKYLWEKKRPKVTRALTAAAAEGDRSENAEYIYRKKQLREIDRRVRYLRKRLDEVRPVPPRSDNPGKVFFGATVTLAEDDGSEVRYRIVGADETDAGRGWISVDSPVARALLGKAVGEEVSVHTPTGDRLLEVVAVDYGVH